MVDAKLTEGIYYLGHSAFMLRGPKVIYIDPYKLKNEEKADVIFITHAHFDHLSPEDLKKISTEKTAIVSPVTINGYKKITIVKPGNEYIVEGIKFRTVPAFNVKIDKLSYHPKENNWVGYIINFMGRKIYHAGDTDFVESMKSFGEIDVALIPMGGTYTMDTQDAIEAANTIKAKVTVPMHYKTLLGNRANDAEQLFKDRVPNTVIMQEYSVPK
jgi:L-ascorbate metabolism protein UlaG (beta-lactamase superfamily)